MSQLREAVAQAYANKRLAEQDYKEGEKELALVERQIPEAAKGGKATKQATLMLMKRKEQLQSHLENRKIEIAFIQQQVEQAQEMLGDFIREMDKKSNEIRSVCAHGKDHEAESELELMMRMMQAKVPKLRMEVAQAYANKRLAEQDYKATREELGRIKRQIPQAVKGGETTKQAALMLKARKKQLETQLHDKKTQLDMATQQAEQAQKTLNDYILEMDAKFTEIRERLAHLKRRSPRKK